MGLFDLFDKRTIKYRNMQATAGDSVYEFCPRCDANLTLQRGYSNELPYWYCKGCGEMLFNPELEVDDNIVWLCDKCGTMLNIQAGFADNSGNWECTACGYNNKIDASEVYLSGDEYEASRSNPYKGLADNDVLALSVYDEISTIEGHENIFIVRNIEDGRLCVRKYLTVYDLSVYTYLMKHPVAHMPAIYGVYEGDNNLVVIEEYIAGKTLSDIIAAGPLGRDEALNIAKSICLVLKDLHNLDRPVIHRDIKPSNIIISDDGEAYLIDINVARWYREEAIEDTRLMGTIYYAAPEQFGYGYGASSDRSDIYAVGILLNVMLTGKIPKEEKASGEVWSIIEKCISHNPEDRYTDDELISALDNILR